MDERRLELCENEIDNTQKSNYEAQDDRKAMSSIKSNELKEEHSGGNIESSSQRIVSNNSKPSDDADSRETNESSISIEVLAERKQKRHGRKYIITISYLSGPLEERVFDRVSSFHNRLIFTALVIKKLHSEKKEEEN